MQRHAEESSYRVACTADWERIAGDGRVRHCPECKLNVYNFSEMTEPEVRRIVAQREGRLCARFYQRPDGTLLTRNCPVGLRTAVLRVSRVATAALAAVMSANPILAKPGSGRLTPPLLFQIKAATVALSLEVVDQAGGAISGAQITFLNEATKKKTEAKTAENGELRIVDLVAGSYEVTIAAPGFATQVMTHVAVPQRDVMKVSS